MAAGPSPLLGYNTNVRHKGRIYHIQTEDSGINHPHIITHLFADGGRIVASKKTSYAEQVGAPDLRDTVKALMREQHKAMFIGLRDGVYDDPSDVEVEEAPVESPAPAPDVAGLDAAAEKLAGERSRRDRAYSSPRQAAISVPPAAPSKPPESIFGSDLLSEKSLDEVILSYLSSDLDEIEE
jgi:hypothetical protein